MPGCTPIRGVEHGSFLSRQPKNKDKGEEVEKTRKKKGVVGVAVHVVQDVN